MNKKRSIAMKKIWAKKRRNKVKELMSNMAEGNSIHAAMNYASKPITIEESYKQLEQMYDKQSNELRLVKNQLNTARQQLQHASNLGSAIQKIGAGIYNITNLND